MRLVPLGVLPVLYRLLLDGMPRWEVACLGVGLSAALMAVLSLALTAWAGQRQVHIRHTRHIRPHSPLAAPAWVMVRATLSSPISVSIKPPHENMRQRPYARPLLARQGGAAGATGTADVDERPNPKRAQ